jgi:hypothetical protein
MIDDPEIQEIAKKQRQQTLKKVGIVLAVIVAAAVYIVPSGGSVASALGADGYTDVDVSREGVFSFTYKAKKDGAECTGSYNKMPGSSSTTGMCVQKSE